MKGFFVFGMIACSMTAFGQQSFYDVTPGNGNGIRFWQNDAYKIHMGNSAEYQYGPVSSYSIKMNISSDPDRGWTWGVAGLTPIAALSNVGNMRIAGKFTVTGDSAPLNFTSSWSSSPDVTTNVSEISNDIVAYKQLMIVGNQAQGFDRRVGIWDRLSIDGAGLSQTLNVNGGGYFQGNVGIGTSAPTVKLEVVGPTTGYGPAIFASGGGDLLLNSMGALFFDGNYSYNTGNYIRPVAANTQSFVTAGIERLRIAPDGNIGVGTKSPNEKLTVNGTIYGKEIKVDLSVPAPDYVFSNDYKLRTVEELRDYIASNGHLPEVPSATELADNGIRVGEINMILLKKVEELTLYLIDVKKENSELRKENEELRKDVLDKLDKLEMQVAKDNNDPQ